MGCTAGGGRFVIILYIPGLGGRSHAQPRQIKVSAEKSNLGRGGGARTRLILQPIYEDNIKDVGIEPPCRPASNTLPALG